MANGLIIAGNWKMNKSKKDVEEFLKKISTIPAPKSLAIVASSFIYLDYLVLNAPSWLKIAAQNVAKEENKGAFTGEISAEMLRSIGVKYALVGHSERRMYYGETPEDIQKKILQCFKNDIIPIFCIGENLEEREANSTMKTIENQLTLSLLGIDDISNLIIAYEPVWAIGTGKTASSSQAEEVHLFIKDWLKEKYGKVTNIPVLYGGSCSPQNAKELFSMPSIAGGLIGGASLEASSFEELINIGNQF